MDKSVHHQENKRNALTHASRGVKADELTSNGRRELLEALCLEFVRAWRPSLPPGFEPWALHSQAADTIDYRDKGYFTNVMTLCRIGSSRDTTLILSSDGSLHYENWNGPSSLRIANITKSGSFSTSTFERAAKKIANVNRRRRAQTIAATDRMEQRLALIYLPC